MYLFPQFSVMALKEKLFPIIGDTSCKQNENIFNDLISKTPILNISNLKLQDVNK